MSLLVDLMGNALDEGYAQAAKRRAAPIPRQESPPRKPARGSVVLMIVVLAMAGGLFATSALAAHKGAAAVKHDRARLLQHIDQQTTTADGLQKTADVLRTKVGQVRDAALLSATRGAALRSQLNALETGTGETQVEGSGVEVVIDNAPAGPSPGDASSLGTVLDSDIQRIVNGLYLDGAQDVAVNGQRLTARSAIREAGDAISVNYRPLTPPYTIDAIGPRDLAQTFTQSQTGQLYKTWQQVYGLHFAITARSHLRLPAAPDLTAHYAKPVDSP